MTFDRAAKAPRLVLMTADTIGGVWNYSVELAAALGERGTCVALATMGAPLNAAQRAQIDLVPTASVHESSFKLEWMNDPWEDVRRAGEWLLALERELRPDVVHLNQFAFGALPFIAPTLVVAHSCVLSWWRAVHRTPAPSGWDRYRETVSDGLFGAALAGAPTRAMLRSLRVDYGYTRGGVVLPNGRSAASFSPGKKEPVIFAAGRLWDSAKNLAALEAVAPQLAWPVLVAGPTSHPDGGEQGAAGASGSGARALTALGELAPKALAQRYASASIYALAARYEPFGLSVLEAALAGCALVLGDLPSLREVWGDCALFVPPDDHCALRATLSRLIADAPLRAELARAARARAIGYTPGRMRDAYLAAYCRITAGSRPGRRRPAPARPSRGTEAVCAS